MEGARAFRLGDLVARPDTSEEWVVAIPGGRSLDGKVTLTDGQRYDPSELTLLFSAYDAQEELTRLRAARERMSRWIRWAHASLRRHGIDDEAQGVREMIEAGDFEPDSAALHSNPTIAAIVRHNQQADEEE